MEEKEGLPLAGGKAGGVDEEVICRLADELELTTSHLETLKKRKSELEEEIARRLHVNTASVDESAEVKLEDGRVIQVTRGARFQWDQELLEDYFGGTSYGPAYISTDVRNAVKRKWEVNRSRFEKLPSENQDEISSALTRRPGPLKVTIS